MYEFALVMISVIRQKTGVQPARIFTVVGHQAVTQYVVSTESLSLILNGTERLTKCFEIQQKLVRG